MTVQSTAKAAAYDRYIDHRRFAIAVSASVLLVLPPIPGSMQDVAVEYTVGKPRVLDFYSRELFDSPLKDAEQRQVLTARSLEACMRQGALAKAAVLRRTERQLRGMEIDGDPEHFARYRALVEAMDAGACRDQTGTACWMARSIVERLGMIGLDSGRAPLAAGALVTAAMTNLMADGPAAAAVGPITLDMAAVPAAGTTLVPFMGLATAAASSFACLLVIGTPPNAIVHSSGYLDAGGFLRVGIICIVVAFVALLVLSAFLWPFIGFEGLIDA